MRTSKACLIKRRLSRVLAGDYMLGYGLELDRGCQEHGKVNSADHTLFVRFATCGRAAFQLIGLLPVRILMVTPVCPQTSRSCYL